ncbi:Ldh family oxidoreductase [Amylibacter sp.]|mgnify:FL=1|jgi:(2R)-3-sulfolactate dehydrogenase (NADP+)|nr:Ldh family oxidoreductase [Amylibacter sp.]MDB0015699.1 Ldh family oxidoreductase [Amylibacter sp.]MDB9991136.1 Ldh family oxidoreductase [Amylibacter sp.]MDC1269379.1 Ldh family oxidoreductase [Amylibacter sp.]MDC1445026.1 Ldh family oxidoreductase [Amylibacter sp.]|tara:strand:- start:840 stop:1838 length:999 start_codon:yes stop_codon:yes gene_type:complete
MEKIEVNLSEVEALTEKALTSHGASVWIAKSVARAVRTAEAKGNLICGLYYLESYCSQLITGRVNGTVEPIVTLPKAASIHVDAKFGFAQAAFERAMPLTIETAVKTGTCSLAISHSHTCTSLGYFTEQIAKSGFIGIGFTNASAVVSPPGGNKAILGTNPIAMAIPSKNGDIAFQFDQSTSAIALGKITMAASAGEAIPLGWAVDSNGNDTTDPNKALKGSLKSSGDYKGWGFGLMTEVLAAAFTGSVNSLDVKGLKLPEGKPHNLGQCYLILDPNTHGNSFFDRIDRIINAVAEQEGTRLPGSNFIMPEFVKIERKILDQLNKLSKGPTK